MSGPGQLTLGLPKPGPVVKAVLLVIALVGVTQAFLVHWAPGVAIAFGALEGRPDALRTLQVWRLVTSWVLSDPSSLNPLLFSLLGIYFLSPELERRWGSARFARFFLASVAFGNLFVIGAAALPGPFQHDMFHPPAMFGAGAAIAAIAVAWAREFPTAQIRLFFFLPVSGKALLWLTLGFAALGLAYPAGYGEGIAAPFGGIAAGLLLAGTPSTVRSLYLKVRLASLQRQSQGMKRAVDARPSGTSRRGGTPAPPLRIVYGGLEEELKKRKPPKDKRYLN